MADGGGLENRYGVTPIVGSNPTPSAHDVRFRALSCRCGGRLGMHTGRRVPATCPSHSATPMPLAVPAARPPSLMDSAGPPLPVGTFRALSSHPVARGLPRSAAGPVRAFPQHGWADSTAVRRRGTRTLSAARPLRERRPALRRLAMSQMPRSRATFIATAVVASLTISPGVAVAGTTASGPDVPVSGASTFTACPAGASPDFASAYSRHRGRAPGGGEPAEPPRDGRYHPAGPLARRRRPGTDVLDVDERRGELDEAAGRAVERLPGRPGAVRAGDRSVGLLRRGREPLLHRAADRLRRPRASPRSP